MRQLSGETAQLPLGLKQGKKEGGGKIGCLVLPGKLGRAAKRGLLQDCLPKALEMTG